MVLGMMVGLLLAAPIQSSCAGTQQRVEGTINDSLGRPIAGAKVRLKTVDGRVVASAITDQNGKFVLRANPGSFELTATKNDFKPAAEPVTITLGKPPTPLRLAMISNQPLTMQVLAPRFDRALNDLSPETGSSAYQFDRQSIHRLPEGDNSNLAQVLQQAPGVSQDSYGQGQEQIHVHGENGGGVQYRVNGIFLPDAVTSYGEIFSPRFVHTLTLLTGVMPAEIGFRNEAVIDVRSKDGCIDGGPELNNLELYGGQRNTFQPSFELGSCSGRLSYYASGFYLRDDLGLQPPTAAATPNHDHTDQGQGFTNLSYLIDSQTRVSLMAGTAVNQFEIPPTPGLTPGFVLEGVPALPSSDIDENELEQNYFGVLGLQGAIGPNIDYQLSAFSRYYTLNFYPDSTQDLIYNGVAARIFQSGFINGLQGAGNYKLGSGHTIGAGFYSSGEAIELDDHAQTFKVVSGVPQTTPITIVDNHNQAAWLLGFYLQDEWRPLPQLKINFGARWDWMSAFVTQNQFSPRLGAEYEVRRGTILHAGYARYFKVPPLDQVALGTVQKFADTTNAAPVNSGNDKIEAETDDYFDVGIRQRILEHLNVGVDGFFKLGHNQLDLSQLGSLVVTAPLNYRQSRAWGSDFSLAYQDEKLVAYFNFSYAILQAKYIKAGAFLADDADEIAYVANHWVNTDDNQMFSSSAGASYRLWGFLFTSDAIWGSGYRRGFANSGELPPILQFNAGIVRSLKLPALSEAECRLSVINLFNHPYQIRNGTGIGVFSASYGPRRAIYGGIKIPLTRTPSP
jgi:TonB dependent receptor/Carboxypeptidase regulatory-like domain/TonB-dependent Receptor Plug Domain